MRRRVPFIFIAGLASPLIGLIAWRPPLALITITLVYAFSGSILTLLALRRLRRRGKPDSHTSLNLQICAAGFYSSSSRIGLIAWRSPLALITIALVYAFSGSILTLLALRRLRRRGNPIAIHR